MTKKLTSYDDVSGTMPGVVESRIAVLASAAATTKLDDAQLDTDATLGGVSPSNTKIPSQAAAKTYADGKASRKQMARTPEQLISGAITRDAYGAATGFSVKWPDGTTGTYSGTASTAFPGAIDSYTITYGSGGGMKTYTQPAVTRDSTTGAVTNLPDITET